MNNGVFEKDDRVSVMENEVECFGTVVSEEEGIVSVNFDNGDEGVYGPDEMDELAYKAPAGKAGQGTPADESIKKAPEAVKSEAEATVEAIRAAKLADDKVGLENAKKASLAAPAKKTIEADPDLVAAEREFRRYVKRTGGLRLDLSDAAKMEALRLQEILGRKEIKWDTSIAVPGMKT